jgi:tetratricopeptide (TPR) repeat protein
MTTKLIDEATAITLCAEGSALSDAGNMPAAVARYREAVAMAPSLLPLHLILANAEQLAGDVLAARETLRQAVRCASRDDVADEFALGKALVDAGAGADAVGCFRRVRSERPHDAAGSAALASALRDAQRPDEAWSEIQHALHIAPTDPVTLVTAALIRHDLSDYAGALRWIEQSLTVRPDSQATTVTRGYLRHLLGDTAGGWRDFEARARPEPVSASTPWTGQPLRGKTITVLGEQGVGDQFQFLRFVRHPVVQTAARVVVSCQPEAVSLLRTAGYDAVARGTAVPSDYFVPLLSLPLRLGVEADWRADDASAYLALPDSPVCGAPTGRRRVGVVWSGNPAHRNDAQRSIPARLLDGLLHAHPSLRFVCMQHDATSADMPSGQWETNAQGDWLETARQLCTLDVLITVDTGIAHLAGALGVPVWILVSHVPDWRWGPVGHVTEWYPSARIFRQPVRGDWSRVLTNVSAALSALALSDGVRTAAA